LSGGVSLSFEATQSIDDDDDGIDRAGGYRRLVSDDPLGGGSWALEKVGVNEANEMERGSEFFRELS
jgi:hypothetical protein